MLRHAILFVILSLAIRHSANAAVIYSGIQNISIDTTFDGTYLDVDTGSHSTSTITGWDVNFFFGGYGIANSTAFQPVRSGTGNMDPVVNLTLGTLINAASTYTIGEAGSDSHMGAGLGQFQSGTDSYIGFKFTTNSNAGPYYGWMRVDLTYNTSGALIKDWAYDNTGLGIMAGSLLVIPEPSRALLLMLGLSTTILRRRRSLHSIAS